MPGLEAFLDHSFTVKRATPTVVQDASAGIKKVYQRVPTIDETACCIRPTDAGTKRQYSQRQMEVSHRVYCELPVALKRGDYLVTDNAKLFEVQGWFDTDDLERLFVIDCREQVD